MTDQTYGPPIWWTTISEAEQLSLLEGMLDGFRIDGGSVSRANYALVARLLDKTNQYAPSFPELSTTEIDGLAKHLHATLERHGWPPELWQITTGMFRHVRRRRNS